MIRNVLYDAWADAKQKRRDAQVAMLEAQIAQLENEDACPLDMHLLHLAMAEYEIAAAEQVGAYIRLTATLFPGEATATMVADLRLEIRQIQMGLA